MKESAYSLKSVCVDAVIACVLGGLSIFSMCGAIFASYLYNGKGPVAVGLLGIGSLLLAVLGLVFTFSAWKSQEGGVVMKRIAGICSAIPLVVALLLYVLGWF